MSSHVIQRMLGCDSFRWDAADAGQTRPAVVSKPAAAIVPAFKKSRLSIFAISITCKRSCRMLLSRDLVFAFVCGAPRQFGPIFEAPGHNTNIMIPISYLYFNNSPADSACRITRKTKRVKVLTSRICFFVCWHPCTALRTNVLWPPSKDMPVH